MTDDSKALVVTLGVPNGIPLGEFMSIRRMQEELASWANLVDLEAGPAEAADNAAVAAAALRFIADRLLADAGTIAVLNGVSLRHIAERAQVRHDTMRRALARSITLGKYATGDGRRRAVTSDGVKSAMSELQTGEIPTAHWTTVAELPEDTPVRWDDSLNALVVRGIGGPTSD